MMPRLWQTSKPVVRLKVQQGAVKPSDLWGRAFNELRVSNLDLVKSLEGLLDAETQTNPNGVSVKDGDNGVPSQHRLAELIETQLTAMKQKQWRIQVRIRNFITANLTLHPFRP